MNLNPDKVRGILCGPLSGRWPDLPLYITLLALADRKGVVQGDPERVRYTLAFPVDLLESGLAALQQPVPVFRFAEDRNGFIRVAHSPGWLRVQICAYRRYIENPRPPVLEWASIRERVFSRDGYECVYCGAGGALECDHIVPVSKGGDNGDQNLATSCKPCNRAKRAKLLRDWRPDLVPVIEGLGLQTEADCAG